MAISKQIIERLKNRDEIAFEIIYQEYKNLVFAISYKITNRRETAEENMQDTFLTMYQKISAFTYINEIGFKNWLMRITKNLALNRIMRDKEKNTIYDDKLILNTESNKQESYQDMINNLFSCLDQIEAEIVYYHLYCRLNFREIGIIFNQTTSIVSKKYYQALKKLKKNE